MISDEQLLDVAAAILDDKPVSWETVPEPETDADRGFLEQMRVLAALTRSHHQAQSPLGTHWGPLLIVERIGSGTFGDVYKAQDTALDRHVALKLLRSLTAGRHLAEGRLLARVRHPNVVTVHGAAEHAGMSGIWMEFIQGRTLAQLVAEHGPFAPEQVTAIGIDVCRALAAVHASGLLHGDIKAQNVMREDGGRIVLMDFGTGRVAGDAPAARLAGTPLYVAPEVLSGEPVDASSDVYAVGVLLYFLLTGAFPVEGRTLAEIRTAHLAGARTSIRDRRSETPRHLATVIDRATAPNRTGRLHTACDLEAALVSIAARRRLLWAGGVTTAAALAVVGLLTWRTLRPSADAGDLKVRATNEGVFATTLGGTERWRYLFPPDEQTEPLLGHFVNPAWILTGASREALIGIGGRVRRADERTLDGEVLAFRAAGNGQPARTFSFDDRLTFGPTVYGPPWLITDLRVNESPGRWQIAVAAHQDRWWPGLVTILDQYFERHGTFVNSGWIEGLRWLSTSRLAAVGFSNDRDAAVVALLDADALDGHSPEPNGSSYRCQNCSAGLPIRYITLPRSELNHQGSLNFNRATIEPWTDGILVSTMEVEPVPPSHSAIDAIYEFSPTLELRSARFSDQYWDRHRTLELEGKLHHSREQCPERDGPVGMQVWEPATGWQPLKVANRR